MIERRSSIVDVIGSYRRNVFSPRQLSALGERKIKHLYEFGLAPIVLDILNSNQGAVSEQSFQLLKSADLTARVMYAQLRSTTIEILEIARRNEIPVVLLKGISIAEDIYTEAHHRIMADVDILVPVDKARELHRLLREAGFYVPRNPDGNVLPKGHHHLPELRHPKNNVPVEVHTSLFSSTPLASEPLFQISTIWTYTETADFHGHRCLKFRAEFQLLYTVAHWAIDQKWPVNVISINDVALMLQRKDRTIDWALVDDILADTPLLADILSVTLLFLNKASIVAIPTAINQQVEHSARRIGTANMKMLHWFILNFPLSDRDKKRSRITLIIVRVFWQTMLQPRNKFLRPVFAVSRILFRRTNDRSILRSFTGRIRTFSKLIG